MRVNHGDGRSGGDHRFLIHNTDRSIGTRLSGAIARQHGNQGMADAPLTLRFRGTAGQSFGAFNAGGLHLELEGEANDYVGKGMAGGRLVVLATDPAAAEIIAGRPPVKAMVQAITVSDASFPAYRRGRSGRSRDGRAASRPPPARG